MEESMDQLLEKTELLDFENKEINKLIEEKQWINLNEKEKLSKFMNLFEMKYRLDII